MNPTQTPERIQGDTLLVLASALHVDDLAPGLREQYIRDEIGLLPGAYFQVLNELLEDPCAETTAPWTIRVLRTRRASRAHTI